MKTAAQIMETTNPKHMKMLGRRVANFNTTIWDTVSQQVVWTVNYAKVCTHAIIHVYYKLC